MSMVLTPLMFNMSLLLLDHLQAILSGTFLTFLLCSVFELISMSALRCKFWRSLEALNFLSIMLYDQISINSVFIIDYVLTIKKSSILLKASNKFALDVIFFQRPV